MRKPLIAFVLATMTAVALAQGVWAGDRVVGGSPAQPGTWPFMAYLLIGGAWQCGGTLVSKTMVLTAAHCTRDADGKPWTAAAYTIRLGSTDRDRGGLLRTVKRVIVHENYDPKTSRDDIALLELSEPADLPTVALASPVAAMRGLVRYAPVSETAPFGKVVGWGRTDAATQSASHDLMEAPIPIIEASACNAVMGGTDRGAIDARQICAGLSQGGVDACNGDSGGPLLAPGQDDQWVEVGVTSWGVSRCGDPHTYGVYTRVAAYSEWLNQAIAKTGGAPAGGPSVPVGGTGAGEGGVLAAAPTVMAAAAREDGKVRIRICHNGVCQPGEGSARPLTVGETFRIEVETAFDGYLMLLDVGGDGKITQLFPNPYSAAANADGRIRAGSTMVFPDKSYGFALTAAQPLGRGRLIAVVAEKKDVLAGVAVAKNGLTDMPNRGLATLDRLEAVLKPQTIVEAAAGAVPPPPPSAAVPAPVKPVAPAAVASVPVPAVPAAKPVATPTGTVAVKPGAMVPPVKPASVAVPAVAAVPVKPAVEKPTAAPPTTAPAVAVVPPAKPVAVVSPPVPAAPVGWAAGQRDYIVVQ